MGVSSAASGDYSTAMGRNSIASGNYSTAMGYYTTASGVYSTAMGLYTIAPSYAETVIGRYNTNYVPAGTTSWNASDRLFVVGNGTAVGAESDAMVILKNGNVGIGTSDPEGQLFVKQIDPLSGGSSGIFVDYNGDNWKAYHSGLHFSFANEGTRYAYVCLLYTSPSPRDKRQSRMPSSA